MFVGRTEGRVVPARGGGSFGWDPIFLPDGFDTTFAEMDKQLKNTISHRHALGFLFRYRVHERSHRHPLCVLSTLLRKLLAEL